jgi:hypothetical protein
VTRTWRDRMGLSRMDASLSVQGQVARFLNTALKLRAENGRHFLKWQRGI